MQVNWKRHVRSSIEVILPENLDVSTVKLDLACLLILGFISHKVCFRDSRFRDFVKIAISTARNVKPDNRHQCILFIF